MNIAQQIKEAESKLKSLKALKESEAAFKRAPAAKKRVMIAKDVLLQLKLKKLIARSGVYVAPGGLNDWGEWLNVEGAPTDFREFMVAPVTPAAQCTACALGSVFACAVKFKNTVSTSAAGTVYSDDSSIKRYLSGVFTTEQLELIECAFERHDDHAGGGRDASDAVQNAVAFGRKHPVDKKRMIAIMKNIIKNEGEFVP